MKIKKPVGGKVGKGDPEDVKVVQTLLNRHASTVGYKKVEVNGKPEKDTLVAIKKFQQECCPEIKSDAKVDPGKVTLMTLNMSAKELKAYYKGLKSDDAGDAAQSIVLYVGKKAYDFTSQNEADKFADSIKKLEINGKEHLFTPKEWKVFQADMIKTLNRTIVTHAKSRAEMAYGLWEHFAELNSDQYVISWFVSLTGPDLPKFSIVNKASSAAKNLESAVKSGNFDRIGKAIKEAEEPINKAYKVMWDYQKAVIGSAENWVTALEVTKTTSFIIVSCIAAPMMVSSVGLAGAGAIASGGTGLLSSSATELGKYGAGTSKGPADAIKNIALTTVVDATVGAVLKGGSGKKIFEGVGKEIVKKTSSKWISKISSKTAQKYITKYLENAAESGIEESIKQVGEVIKGKTKPEDFFGKVATAMVSGGVLKSFDKVVDDKLGLAIYNSMSTKIRESVFGEMKSKVAITIINDLVKNNTGNIAGNGIDYALSKATGKETEKSLIDSAAKKVTGGSDYAKFQKLLAKKAKR